jgi:adenine specific DNA methylase Mod
MIQQIAKDNETVTPISREMEGLKEYFPQCFNQQGEFDIDKFREAIQLQVDVTREGRSYDFLGKSYARMLSSLDTTTVIRPDTEHNSKPENQNSENIYISGDNLDALHHLTKSYAGQVKCIYIDPPYNTGTDGFVYNDKFKFTADELEKKLSISPDEAEKIIAMTSGHRASHAAWLTFMMPRLQLARDLLSKDGVIFISIDENEHANLKLLCDHIFGEDNLAGEIIWKNSSKNDEDYISIQHEYILSYVKNKEYNKGEWIEPKQGTDEIFAAFDKFHAQYSNDWKAIHQEALKWYKQFNESNPIYDSKHYNWMDERGVYFPSDISGPNYGQYRYDVIHPVTGKVCKEPASGWRFPEKEMVERIKANLVHFGDDETTIPNNKTYLKDTLNQSLTSVKYKDGRVATKKLTALMGCNCFTNPKDVDMLAKLFSALQLKDGDIVLDFFSGSGTTAESVLGMNAQGLKLKYILVQIPENLDESYKRATGSGKTVIKNAIELCDTLSLPHTVDQIGMERIKRAAKKIKEENPLFAGDLGFKHYTLEEVPENTLDKLETFDPNVILSTDDVLNMFGRETVLATWLVNDGYGLGAKTEDIVLDKYHATLCGNHLYLTDGDFTENDMAALVDRYQSDPAFNPDCIVLFGYSFGHNAKDMLEKNKPTINLVKDKNIIIDVRY